MITHEWADTIINSVLTLVAGSGWVTYALEKRKARKEATRAVLDSFLYPLQSILNQNKRFQQALIKDAEFGDLEYAADYLQEKFSSLPDNDSRKVTWKALIEGLLEQNDRAVQLIHENAGSIKREDFRQSCEAFIDHAREWSALWRATIDSMLVPDEMKGRDKLKTPAFPESMDKHLSMEIEQRRREAGIPS